MKRVIPKNAFLIPKGAKLAFKGNIFDVYQWPQTMFDGSTKTFEMLKRPDTLQVIAVKDNKLVLVHDEQPGRSSRLHFPGGRVDPGDDSWHSAAKRELLEETGLSFRTWKLVNVFQPAPKIEWFVPWLLATDFENQQAQNLDKGGERITVSYHEFGDVKEMIMSGSEPTMAYALPLFYSLKNINDLLALQPFAGEEVEDRTN